MEVFHVSSERGCVDSELEKAFMFALVKAELTSPTSRVIFVIHTKQNTGWFERLTPLKGLKIDKLFTGISISAMDRDVTIIVSSVKDIIPKDGDVVIYLSLRDEDAFILDDKLHGKDTIRIGLPMLPSALDTWKELWQAQILNPISTPISISTGSYEPLDCVVEKGLDKMDSSSFKGNTNSSDEEQIKTIVRTLYKYNSTINNNSIASYLAIHQKWKPSRAIFVKELYKKLTNGKTFQGGEKTGHQKRIKEWKKLC